MASVLAKEVGLSVALNSGFAAYDISSKPDVQTVSKSVITVPLQASYEIVETATTIGINAARKSGMSWSKSIATGLKNGLTKPLQVLKAAKSAADASRAVAAATKASAKVAEKVGAEVAEKVAAEVAEKVAKEIAEVAVKKATSQAAALGTKWTALSTGGPVGWALVAVQITFAVLDILWNPFETYFNKDLAKMKETIDSSIRKQFLENGSDYPLEIKPNIIPSTDEEIEEYYKLKKEYYDNNGLISSEEVLKEEQIYAEISSLNREMEIGLNPLYDNINLLSGTTQNIAILVAIAATKKRAKERLSKAIDLKNYKPSKPSDKYLTWIKLNWQLLVIISVIIIIIICSLFVLFVV